MLTLQYSNFWALEYREALRRHGKRITHRKSKRIHKILSVIPKNKVFRDGQ
jgi:hypothetical protein